MSGRLRAAHQVILIVVLLWLAGSVAFSLTGLFDQPSSPPTFFGLFLTAPPVGFLIAYAASRKVREALFAIPLWFVVAIHSARFVGFAFIAGALTHDLPPAFGWPAGAGDIISAIFSIPLARLLYLRATSRGLRMRFVAWNLFGLTDLVTAVTLGLLYSQSVWGVLSSPTVNTRSLSFLPLSLVPTFYVPILVLLHFLALRRVREIPE
jgi:hypothetical protein